MRIPSIFRLLLGLWLGSTSLRAATQDPFQFDAIYHFDLELSASALAELSQSSFNRRMPETSHRPKVKGRVTIEGEVFEDVSIKLKGSAGSFRPLGQKPAWTINLDTHVEDQHFRGYDKFYLNNSRQDPSYCNEIISRELFQRAGIPVPRANLAVVRLNGQLQGLYVMVEGFNRRFLKRHFKHPDGNLYDGGFLNDIYEELKLDTGKSPDDHSALQGLISAVYERDLQAFLPGLTPKLDLDLFLTHMALDVLTWNWDGYAMNRNNYRLYHNLDTGKFQFIPHGMDQMFEQPYGPIFPRLKGDVAQYLMRLPAIRSQYFEKLRSLYGTVFQPGLLVSRVDQISAVIASELPRISPDEARYQQRASDRLKQSLRLRGEFLTEQLSAVENALQFPETGIVPVTDWKSRSVVGNVAIYEERLEGRSMLMFDAKNGDSPALALWTSTQMLRQGVYQLEGTVQIEGVVPKSGDTLGGVGMSVSGFPAEARIRGTQRWIPMSRQFTVNLPVEKVTLYCEFRAMSGKAWFDKQSLRLRRLR